MQRAGLLKGHSGPVVCVSVCPSDQNRLLSGSEDGTARVWDVVERRCVRGLKVPNKDPVCSVAWGPNEDTMFVATDKTVYQYDMRIPGLILSQSAHSYAHSRDDINCVSVSPAGDFLTIADDTGEVHVVDLSTNQKSKTLGRQHRNICSSVAFRPGRRWECISGGLDSTVVVWDFSRGRPIQTLEMGDITVPGAGGGINPPFVHSLAVSGGRFAVGLGNCAAAVFADQSFFGDATKKGPKGKQKVDRSYQLESVLYGGHQGGVSSVCFLLPSQTDQPATSHCVVSGGNDKSLCVWDISIPHSTSNLRQEPPESGKKTEISDKGTDKEKQQEEAGSELKITDLISRQLVKRVEHGSKIHCVAAGWQGRSAVVYVGDMTNNITVYSLGTV